jgi:hypothetical protein
VAQDFDFSIAQSGWMGYAAKQARRLVSIGSRAQPVEDRSCRIQLDPGACLVTQSAKRLAGTASG